MSTDMTLILWKDSPTSGELLDPTSSYTQKIRVLGAPHMCRKQSSNTRRYKVIKAGK
ncbi:MAG: hypothetical protein M1456_02400 [Actinobacteria bacterium]|nr:hypothetical protein [Actinomycetota bacterium]MCL5885772.1 hypothetical protein [Actinomycetota bacterium]